MTIDAGSLMEAAKQVDRVLQKKTLYYFRYSDGKITQRLFDSHKDASWFAHNEGDHLIEWGRINETTTDKSL
jgi:hypothetical protein